MSKPLAYTPREAGEILRCSADQVRALCRTKRLAGSNVGLGGRRAKWVISQEAIDAFLGVTNVESPKKRRPPATTKKWI